MKSIGNIEHIKYKEGRITVHAWVFDVSTGNLIDLKIDFDNIMNGIREIYHIF